MRRILTLLILASIITLSFNTKIVSSQFQTVWIKTFDKNSWDESRGITQTIDGGCIIVGHTGDLRIGGRNLWLLKIDAKGNKVWEKELGGDYDDFGKAIQVLDDGGFIIVGSTSSYSVGGYDVWLIRTDSDGNVLWTKTFGGGEHDYGYYVQQTSDGGFIIVGSTESSGEGGCDLLLIKTDSNGDKIWEKTFGGLENDVGYCVQQSSDGGFIIVGYTESFGSGNRDLWLLKTNANGDIVWEKTYGGEEWDEGLSVIQTADGGFIITGATSSFGAGMADLWVIKVNANGDKIWDKTFGQSKDDYGRCIIQTSDGGYGIVGYATDPKTGNKDLWFIKIDNKGNLQWDRTYGDILGDEGWSVCETLDGDYVAAGFTYSYTTGGYDILVVKMKGPRAHVVLGYSGLKKPGWAVVDGVNYTLPYTFAWTSGSVHEVQVPEVVFLDVNVRGVFIGWNDGVETPKREVETFHDVKYIAKYKIQYYVNASSNIPGLAKIEGSGWYDNGATATLSVPQIIEKEEGVRYVFTGWSDGETSPIRMFTVYKPLNFTANYKKQYYLKIETEHGRASGEGWYDEGSTAYATLNVERIEEFPFVYFFEGWSGDVKGKSLKSDPIVMDSPKIAKATWSKEISTTTYIMIIVPIVILSLAYVTSRMKKKK